MAIRYNQKKRQEICETMKSYGFECPKHIDKLTDPEMKKIVNAFEIFKSEPRRQFYNQSTTKKENSIEMNNELQNFVQLVGKKLDGNTVDSNDNMFNDNTYDNDNDDYDDDDIITIEKTTTEYAQCPLPSPSMILPSIVWQKQILYDLPTPESLTLNRGMRGSVGQILYVPTVLTALFAFPWQSNSNNKDDKNLVPFDKMYGMLDPIEISQLRLLAPCDATASDIAFLQTAIRELFAIMIDYQGFLGTSRMIEFGTNINQICGKSLPSVTENPNIDAVPFLLFMYNVLGVPINLIKWAARPANPVITSLLTSQEETQLQKDLVHNEAVNINNIIYRYQKNSNIQELQYQWQLERINAELPLLQESRIFTIDNVYDYSDLLSAMNAMRVKKLPNFYTERLKQFQEKSTTKKLISNEKSLPPSVEIYSLISYPTLFTIQLNRSLESPIVIPPILNLQNWSTQNVGNQLYTSVGLSAIYFLRVALCHGCLYIVDPNSLYQQNQPRWYFYSVNQNPKQPGEPIFHLLDDEFLQRFDRATLKEIDTMNGAFIDAATMLPNDFISYLYYHAEILLYEKDREY